MILSCLYYVHSLKNRSTKYRFAEKECIYFTTSKLIAAIIKNPTESRREYVLNLFETAGKKSSSNFRFKFWEHENHPVILDSDIVFNQKINYLHWNPVTGGFVTETWYWKYSSAVDYITKEKGVLDLVMLA
jgi:putative transposase